MTNCELGSTDWWERLEEKVAPHHGGCSGGGISLIQVRDLQAQVPQIRCYQSVFLLEINMRR